MFSRYLAVLSASYLLLFPQLALEAQGAGLGIMLGQPSALMATFSLKDRAELDIGASLSWDDWILILGDIQFHGYLTANSLDWRGYYGIGTYVQFGFRDDDKLGIRLPLGLSYRFPHARIEILGELAPGLQLVPETKPRFQWGVGTIIWL